MQPTNSSSECFPINSLQGTCAVSQRRQSDRGGSSDPPERSPARRLLSAPGELGSATETQELLERDQNPFFRERKGGTRERCKEQRREGKAEKGKKEEV